MKQWYYKVGDKESGPVSQEELMGMLKRKELGSKTLVKGGNIHDWTPVNDLEFSAEPLLDIRPSEPDVPTEETRIVNEMPKSRPWTRFVGRMFDYTWFLLIAGWILAGMGYAINEAPTWIIIIPFLWIFVEAIFMGTWGMTPGKWMTQTFVTKAGGKKLSMRDALYRSLSVWWLGMGAGIPFIAFITMIVACVKLSNMGETTWDRSGKYFVEQKKIGPFRLIALSLFFLAFFWSTLPMIYYGS
ncbi:MAG: RDD family protein [Chlamydiales bacterium]|nr:RDD family protein [Chlamydiales bacterium]